MGTRQMSHRQMGAGQKGLRQMVPKKILSSQDPDCYSAGIITSKVNGGSLITD